jgi:3'(2'), 5'-bisphosphate nucleotidase
VTDTPYRTEVETAARLAREAGAAAMAFYGTDEKTIKEGGSPVTAADLAANRVIVAGLRTAFPGDAVLSEESKDDPARLEAERVWIVDPLDGTKEFLAQNGEFSVMIALVAGGEPVVGIVYRPDGDTLYRAEAGQGAWRERGGEAPARLGAAAADAAARPEDGLRMVGSRSHGDPLIDRIGRELGVTEKIPHGSVGLKCALLADGGADVYVHPVPYLSEWDTCAPEVVLREAGGWVSDCRGERLRYNKAGPKQPEGILALAPRVDRSVVETIERSYAEGA